MNSKGVTLIELLLVVGIISIIAVVGGDILLTVVRSYEKAQILGEVEQNGTLVSTVLENTIRDGSVVKYKNGGAYTDVPDGTTISADSIKIVESSGTAETIMDYIAGNSGRSCTNGHLDVNFQALSNIDPVSGASISKRGSGFFSIYKQVGSPAVISINFDVKEGCASPVTASANFNTTVVMRGNYGN